MSESLWHVDFDTKTCPFDLSLQKIWIQEGSRRCLCSFSQLLQKKQVQHSSVGCCSQAFPAWPLFAVLFTRLHIGIIKDLVQTNQGPDCSELSVFLRCYAISGISSSLQWIPLSGLRCSPFPAQNPSSLFGDGLRFHSGFDSLLLILSELRCPSSSLMFSCFFFLIALPQSFIIILKFSPLSILSKLS